MTLHYPGPLPEDLNPMTCPGCGGSGRGNGAAVGCPTCNGHGRLWRESGPRAAQNRLSGALRTEAVGGAVEPHRPAPGPADTPTWVRQAREGRLRHG